MKILKSLLINHSSLCSVPIAPKHTHKQDHFLSSSSPPIHSLLLDSLNVTSTPLPPPPMKPKWWHLFQFNSAHLQETQLHPPIPQPQSSHMAPQPPKPTTTFAIHLVACPTSSSGPTHFMKPKLADFLGPLPIWNPGYGYGAGPSAMLGFEISRTCTSLGLGRWRLEMRMQKVEWCVVLRESTSPSSTMFGWGCGEWSGVKWSHWWEDQVLEDDNAGNDNWQARSTQGIYMSATSDVHLACAESISLDFNLLQTSRSLATQ